MIRALVVIDICIIIVIIIIILIIIITIAVIVAIIILNYAITAFAKRCSEPDCLNVRLRNVLLILIFICIIGKDMFTFMNCNHEEESFGVNMLS